MALEFDGDRMLKANNEYLPEHPERPLCACTAFSCNKLFLFMYGCLYVLVGAALLLLGSWIVIQTVDYGAINNDLFLPSVMLIGVGFVITINSLFAVAGAVRESSVLLKLFLVITVLAFLTQVAIGVLAFISRQKIPNIVSSDLMYLVKGYSDNKHYKRSLDNLQSSFRCCGFESYADFEENMYYGCGSGYKQECGVPWTCCLPPTGSETLLRVDCGFGLRFNESMPVNKIHTMGCIDRFLSWVSFNLDMLGVAGLGTSIPQIIAILLAYYLIRKVKENQVWYRVGM